MAKQGREALYKQLYWDDVQGLTDLTLFDYPQGITAQSMAPTKRRCGRGRRGSTHQKNMRSMIEGYRGCKPGEDLIAEEATTYRDEKYEEIQKLIDNWEAKIK